MLSNLSVRRRLFLIVSLFLAGFVAYGALAQRTLHTTKVNGPIYTDIVQNKDLVADVLPPPEYIIEAYLVSMQMAEETDPARLTALLDRGKQLRTDFDARHDFWSHAPLDARIKEKISVTSFQPALEFFNQRDNEFIPALKRGDRQAARDLLKGTMTARYEEHRKAIDELVVLLNEQTTRVEHDAGELINRDTSLLWVLGFLIIVSIVVSTYFVAHSIMKPLQQFVERMRDIAEGEGDLTARLDEDREDEFGTVARCFNQFIARIQSTIAMIGQTAQTLSASAEEFTAVSRDLSGSAQATNQQASSVSAASGEITTNVQTVAAASEEMSASIRQVAKNASEAAEVVVSAVQMTERTNETVARLGESSNEIGQVIKVITSIAEQTNLLALNATIEAARAGEAGKGFSVVANEVKELAKQTARATEDIEQKIRSIQVNSTEAIEAIGQIASTIGRINEIQSTIAAAVEQQASTSSEIGRNIGSVAQASGEIGQHIARVAETAQATSAGTAETETAAAELARMATTLESLVQQFKYAESAPAAVVRSSIRSPSRVGATRPAHS